MLGTILSNSSRDVVDMLLVLAALSSSFVTWRVWKHSKKKDKILEAEKLAKQKDLDKTNQNVMNNQSCIKSLDLKKASTDFVEDKLKVVHNRINDSNKESEKNFKLLLTEIRLSRTNIESIMKAMKIP